MTPPGQAHLPGQAPPAWAGTPLGGHPQGDGQWAGGAHPTGKHSCYWVILLCIILFCITWMFCCERCRYQKSYAFRLGKFVKNFLLNDFSYLILKKKELTSINWCTFCSQRLNYNCASYRKFGGARCRSEPGATTVLMVRENSQRCVKMDHQNVTDVLLVKNRLENISPGVRSIP